VFARDLVDQLRSTNKRRIPGADRALEWHRAVAPGREVGENTTHGRALSRLKHGFESRREGTKGVRSSLRRQSFSSDSKREVIAPALGRTRRGFAPATSNFGKRRVACGEPEKARGLLTGWSRTAGLSSGALSQPGRRGGSATTSWRSASRSHTVVLRLPDNGRNLVAPGCVECRALPHFALWCAAKVRDYWRRGLRIPYPPP